ncbi:AAA family ATPase [Azospirillum argentinense]
MADHARMFAPLTADELAAVSEAAATGAPAPKDAGTAIWEPVLPVPDDTPRTIPRHPLGKPIAKWLYRDANGKRLGMVCRFDRDGGKDVVPLVFARNTVTGETAWRWQAFSSPRPLYGLDRLAAHPDAPVLVVEGEKAADAAATLFPGHVAVTSPGGSKAADKANWSALAGRPVVIWPDNDPPGSSYAKAVAHLARAAGASSVATVQVPADWPTAWDLADEPPPGVTVDDLRYLLEKAVLFDATGSANPGNSAAPDPESISARAWNERTIAPTEWLLGPFAKTTRAMLSAPSGVGKTNFALALAAHLAAGLDFLHWTAHRPARVLYIDGEMPCELIQQRVRDAERRLGRPVEGLYVLAKDAEPDMPPLNTPEGQAFADRWIEAVSPDFIVFDNVMSLLTGEMSDETGWQAIKPWIAALTNHRVGQLWVHHTGHDGSRPFGTSTRIWNFDASILLTPLKGDDDVAFSLEFQKARRRTPDTRDDYGTITVALADDKWTASTAGSRTGGAPVRGKPPSPTAQRYHDALLNAIASATGDDRRVGPGGVPAATNDAWKREAIRMGLIDKEPDNRQRANFSKYRTQLVAAEWVAVDGETVWSRRLPHAEPASGNPAQPKAQPSRNHPAKSGRNHSATMRNPLSNRGATIRNHESSPDRNHAQPSSIGDGCTVAGLRDDEEENNTVLSEPDDGEVF